MKRIAFIFTCIAVAILSLVSCKDKVKPSANEFQITVSNIEATSADIKIECMKSQELAYYWTVIESEEYKTTYSSDIQKVVSAQLSGGKTVADITVKGNTSTTVTDLDSETLYTVLVVSVDNDGVCKNDMKSSDFTTPQGEVAKSDLTFTFDVTFVSQDNIVVDIKTSNSTDAYFFGIQKASEYTGAEDEVNAYIDDFIKENPDADKEDALRMTLRKGPISYSFSSLDAETEYTIYAIGMTQEGYYTTEESTHNETTLPDALEFTITPLNITSVSADIYYKPSRSEDRYFCGYMSENDYYSLCEGTEAGIRAYIEKYISDNGSDLDELCHKGNYNEHADNLEPATKYYMYAAAVGDDGKCIGSAFTDYFTTKESQTFNFEITSTTENSISYKVTTNDASSTYYTYYITNDEFAEDGEQAIKDHIAELGNGITDKLKEGTTYNDITGLEAGTEYCVFAVGVNEDRNITSEISYKVVQTKTAETPTCTFEIELLSIDSKSATVRFTPSDENFGYIRNCIAVEDLDGQPSEEVIASAALAYLESQVGGYYSTFEDVLRINSWTGVREKTFIGTSNQISPMVAGKEYVAFAVGFDNDKNQTCKLFYITFTLPAE